MKIMEHISKKTIILVDEVFLAEQWNEYLREWTNLEENKDYLLIHGKMKKKNLELIDDMKVIIASKDSLIKKPELVKQLNVGAGLMIIDECHIVSAKVFTKVAAQFNTKWILGLSASIDRDDGLSFLVHSMVGEVLKKATIFDSVKLGSSILPKLNVFFLKKSIHHYEFKSDFKGRITEPYANMSKTVLRDKYCMNFICYNIYKHYIDGDSQLVITQRVEESEMYKEFLIRAGAKEEEIGVILGKTKPAERIRIIEAAKKKEIKIIITSRILRSGTYQVDYK